MYLAEHTDRVRSSGGQRVPARMCARDCGQAALAIPPFAVIGVYLVLVSVSLKLPTLFAWPKTSLGGPLGRDHCSQTLGFPASDLVPQSCPAWSCDRRIQGPWRSVGVARGRPGLLHTPGTEVSHFSSPVLPAYLRNV